MEVSRKSTAMMWTAMKYSVSDYVHPDYSAVDPLPTNDWAIIRTCTVDTASSGG